MMRLTIFLFTISAFFISCNEDNTKKTISDIFNEARTDSSTYYLLKDLTENYPDRISCSPIYHKATKWAKEQMSNYNLDTIFFQECEVKNWSRGEKEKAYIISKDEKISVNVLALGRGIGTGKKGVKGKIIEVKSFEELQKLGKEKIKGKIVFYNRPAFVENGNVFGAYGNAVNQRFEGPNKAAEFGAIGAIVRSIGTGIDEHPHSGVTGFNENTPTVPAIAISTLHAEQLSKQLKEEVNTEFFFKTNCENRPDTISYNIIGELKGSEFPNKVITIGGHFDAWGPGAHDDGAGCLQALEVLRIFKKLNIQPKHTIRAVFFADEEISQGGAKAYADEARRGEIINIAAMESDRGVETPAGFTIKANSKQEEIIKSWAPLFEEYNINVFKKGYAGVDINNLEEFGTALIGYLPNSVHYFDWHHAPNDTWDKVDFNHFKNGAAAMAAMIYLIDKNGL